MKRWSLTRLLVAAAAATSLVLSGCDNAGPPSGGSKGSIHVLGLNGGPFQDLKKLTKEHFTAETGIKVDYTLLPENRARATAAHEFESQAGHYDVAIVGSYEVPIYSKRGWLTPLNSYARADKSFDQNDMFPNLMASLTGTDGKIYAEPFFGEGSFLMYRKDLFQKNRLTMPPNPTWDQVASLAAKVDGTDGAKGICLRGLPGWGQNLAPINTVVNTFGGAWYDMKWNAQLTSPAFKKAVGFYVDLVRKYGQPHAYRSGVLENLSSFVAGKCAMMYDGTSLASLIEADSSTVKGKVGYVPAPHDKTQKAGWLWAWSWAIQNAGKNKDAAWKFISWASSRQYYEQVGKQLGWTAVPAGSRRSLYANPEFQKASAGWYRQEYLAETNSADPRNPGVSPRPYTGIQYVDIPEFADLGDKVSQEISSAIAGRQSVDTALQKSQELAQAAAAKYRTS
ncbi:ABC transporter substrate-binding protein [Streptomyces sp. NPDC008313]|uniref:ABC transporter substrate-binding protein n=1 Tax=Streptomyces sp. NPDC008313 TaxID=3364826 RepID=UPI0036E7155E